MKALVTGGSRGIGRAVAQALTAAGHEVTIVARRPDLLAEAVAAGVAAQGHALDMTDGEAVARFAEGRRFDILVNNAGGADTAPFLKTSDDDFRRAFAVNVESALGITRLCLPQMIGQGFGRIVNIASTAGLKGYAYAGAYAAAKHAMVGWTRSLALELAQKGVTVNAVCPGYTDTDLVAQGVAGIVAKTGRSQAEALAHFAATNSLGRLVRPREVADTVLWLSGEGASAVTGQAIVVAGGEL